MQSKPKPIAKKLKFGIQVSEGIFHALNLTQISGTTFWKDVMKKKLANIAEYNIFKPFSRVE